MRVAHVTTVPVTLNFLRGVIAFLVTKGFDVHVMSAPGQELEEIANSVGATPHGLRMARKITPTRDLLAVFQLARVLRRAKINIVHSHTPKGGIVAMLAAVLARTPVRVHHFHGSPYMAAEGRRRLVLQNVERLSCFLAHRVICVSPSLREQAVRDRICNAEKMIVFGAGSVAGIDAKEHFNPDRFTASDRNELKWTLRIPEGASVVGFVGRIVKDKGLHELATAWQRLREMRPEAYLILVGPVEEEDPVDAELLNELRADSRVRFVGAVADTSRYYSIMDVMALPTYREGFGNVNMEANAMGVPVVSTLVTGCVDSVVNNVTGTLVPPRDVESLYQAIARYLNDSELGKQHGLAGRSRVLRDFQEGYIWNSIYEEYCEHLRAQEVPIPLPVQ